jgi:putative peptidoglycan lipid II flippase
MRRLFAVVGLEVKGMHHAAYVLAGFALGSQLLALVRDRLLASSFGAGQTLDLYYAAFRIPDLLFVGVASLLSLYALLPVLSKLEAENPGLVISFMRKMLILFFAGMGLLSAVAYFFAPQLVAFVAPGLIGNEARMAELVFLTQILLLQPILLGLSNLLANLTQLRHRFVLYSISPLLYNLGIIAGIVFLYPTMGLPGLAWGVVIGAALHALVQLPFFTTERETQKLPWQRTLSQFKEVLVLSVPRTFSLAAGQIALLSVIAVASLLPAGSISVFTFAWNLQAVPLTIIGVSYSVAAFPTLARFFAGQKRDEFVQHIEAALRHIIFWSLPAIVLIVVLRAHIVRVILGFGAFDWSATRLVAAALALFVLSLAAQSISLLIARAYYAAGNTVKPLMLAILEVVVAVVAALSLVVAFDHYPLWRLFVESMLRVEGVPGTEVLMLALGLTLGAVARFAVGLALVARDFDIPLKAVRRLSFESLSASIIGGTAAYATLQLFTPIIDTTTVPGILTQGAAAGTAGLLAAFVVLAVLKSRELAEIVGAARQKLVGVEKVAVEPSDVAQVPK